MPTYDERNALAVSRHDAIVQEKINCDTLAKRAIKSHDADVLMQRFLPIVLRAAMRNPGRR